MLINKETNATLVLNSNPMFDDNARHSMSFIEEDDEDFKSLNETLDLLKKEQESDPTNLILSPRSKFYLMGGEVTKDPIIITLFCKNNFIQILPAIFLKITFNDPINKENTEYFSQNMHSILEILKDCSNIDLDNIEKTPKAIVDLINKIINDSSKNQKLINIVKNKQGCPSDELFEGIESHAFNTITDNLSSDGFITASLTIDMKWKKKCKYDEKTKSFTIDQQNASIFVNKKTQDQHWGIALLPSGMMIISQKSLLDSEKNIDSAILKSILTCCSTKKQETEYHTPTDKITNVIPFHCSFSCIFGSENDMLKSSAVSKIKFGMKNNFSLTHKGVEIKAIFNQYEGEIIFPNSDDNSKIFSCTDYTNLHFTFIEPHGIFLTMNIDMDLLRNKELCNDDQSTPYCKLDDVIIQKINENELVSLTYGGSVCV